jgi:uncharacterized protein YndB with AHSA1/START domain
MQSPTNANTAGITITREFDAPRERVWKAWTEPELIKRWWGPANFTAPSIKVDLRVGGMYIFAMQGPAGSQWDKVMYSAGVYKEIVPFEKMVVTDYFSDEHGKMLTPAEMGLDANFPMESVVTVLFEEAGKGRTRLSIVYPMPESEAQHQAILKSGMTEGWNSSLDKLAEALK